MDYSKKNAKELYQVILNERPKAWLAAADAWKKMAAGADTVAAGISSASGEIKLWRQSKDSDAQEAFDGRIGSDLRVLKDWADFGRDLGPKLDLVGQTILSARTVLKSLADQRQEQLDIRERAADDYSARSSALRQVDFIDGKAREIVKVIADMMAAVVTENMGPKSTWEGPRAVFGNMGQPQDHRTGDASPGGGGVGSGGVGSGGGGAGVGSPADKPAAAAKPAATPSNPVDETGKLIDLWGKGFDAAGKGFDAAGKGVDLLGKVIDLGKGDAGTSTVDPKDLLPSGLIPDLPVLAGEASTAPTFDPAKLGPAASGTGSGGVGGLPSIGGIGALGNNLTGATDRAVQQSSKSASTAGGPGAEPTLAGKAASAASAATQQSMPPMYPPQSGGMGAAGNNARADIKPGTAPPRSGFTLPAEPTEAQRLRRQGVQSDLQGRTNGEHRAAAGAPPVRKRKRAAKPTDQDVLDEELWRP